MNNVTSEIAMIKTEVRERNWETMISECQQSGMPVKQWCLMNGINPSTYYSRLRKLREKVCREIVPIELPTAKAISEIKVVCGDIVISLPSDIAQETLTKILMALKSC